MKWGQANRLLYIFWDTDMRVRHAGLAAKALKEAKIKIADLETGHLLCFINRKLDRIMVLAGTDEEDSLGVLGYYRSPHGRIDVQAIQFIPQAFGAEGVRYDKALKLALGERLTKRRRQKREQQ